MLKVTFDTNVVPVKHAERKALESALAGKRVDIQVVTVTERELKGTSIAMEFKSLAETMVWDESLWDQAVWAEKATPGSPNPVDLEVILKIISNGSFPNPGARSSLSEGQKRQLRDAMILEAHARERRAVLVSNDARAFGRPGEPLRMKLVALLDTRIMSLSEFFDYLKSVP
jgi:hypothetical protein